MIFFKRTVLFLVIFCNVAPLYAMKPEKKIPLLHLYPVPNFSTSWLANVFNGNQVRELAHKRAITQAKRKRDYRKIEVFEYLYAGYFQVPKLFRCACGDSLRERRGRKLFNTLVKEQRNELALLLLMHMAPDDHYKSLTFAINSARPREMIQLLQRYGVNIDALNSEGYTLLSSLACKGNREKVDLLLSCGADVNQGYCALPELYRAKPLNGQKMISLLLAHGAAIDASDGEMCATSFFLDESYHAIKRTAFHLAIESNDQAALRTLLQNTLFEPTKTEISARQKRILTTLCLFKRLGLASDIRFLILSHMREEVCTQNHCVWLLRNRMPLEQLVPHCRFSWLQQMYHKIGQENKSIFLEKLVPLIVQYRMGKVTELLNSRWLLDFYCLNLLGRRFKRHDINPAVLVVIDPDTVDQHKDGIEQNVRNAILCPQMAQKSLKNH